jgi:hypothetical protein
VLIPFVGAVLLFPGAGFPALRPKNARYILRF